jgi:low temperature requirement protein LtrA
MSIKFAPNIHNLPERFGSFTIIVLGISILAVVDGISSHKWTPQSITDAALGLGIAFSLWWIYFDSVDGAEIKALRSERRVGVYLSWLYIHFPLLIGFTALGVSIEHVVLSNQNLAMPFAETWLLCISVSMCLFSLGVMHITSEKTKAVRNISLTKSFPMSLYGIIAGTVVIIIAISDEGLLPVFLMFAMAIACAGQVVLDIRRHPHHRLFKM